MPKTPAATWVVRRLYFYPNNNNNNNNLENTLVDGIGKLEVQGNADNTFQGATHMDSTQSSQQQITTFDEMATVSVDKSYMPRKDYPAYPLETLTQFLSRPYPLETVSWDASQTTGTLLTSYAFPRALLALPFIWDKTSQFQYMRGSVRVSIRMNGTKTHYGKIIAMWSPYADYSQEYARRTSNIYSVTGFPHVIVSPTENEVNELVLPFISPFEYATIGGVYETGNAVQYSYGCVYIYVFNPLQNVASGGSEKVSFTVYANFEDLVLAGYTAAIRDAPLPAPPYTTQWPAIAPVETFHAQGFVEATAVLREANAKAKGGALSSALEKFSGAFAMLSPVPLIGGAMGTASFVAKQASNIAKMFGYAKPDSVETVKRVTVSYVDTANTHGSDAAIKLATQPENSLSCGQNIFGGRCDMDFDTICGTPMLTNIITWQQTKVSGDQLLRIYVTPMNHRIELRDDASYSYADHYHTYLSHVASAFKYWRGDMKYYLQITCSPFHSGRLRISYDPFPYGVLADDSEMANRVSKIVDIQTETDVSFTLPYMSYAPFLATDFNVPPGTIFPYPVGVMGVIEISVVNPLIASSSSTAPVYINMWQAGANMQFGVPQAVYFDRLFPTSTADEEIFEAQGLTQQQIISLPYEPLIPAQSFRAKGVAFGEEYTNVKDLMQRPTPAIQFSMTGEVNHLGVDIFTPFVHSFEASPRIFGIAPPTYLSYFTSIFRFWRGSLRYKFFEQQGAKVLFRSASIIPLSTKEHEGWSVSGVSTSGHSFTKGETHGGVVATREPVSNALEVTVPFNYNGYCRITNAESSLSNVFVQDNFYKLHMQIFYDGSVGTEGSKGVIMQSAGDDFELGFLVAPPRTTFIQAKTAQKIQDN